jgi:hypothetical protein
MALSISAKISIISNEDSSTVKCNASRAHTYDTTSSISPQLTSLYMWQEMEEDLSLNSGTVEYGGNVALPSNAVLYHIYRKNKSRLTYIGRGGQSYFKN